MSDEKKREMLNDERGIKDSSSSIHHSSFRVHRLAFITHHSSLLLSYPTTCFRRRAMLETRAIHRLAV
jgi:hypothetical protein